MVVQRSEIEDVVVDGDDGPSGEPDVASTEHPHRVHRRRPIEGLGHRRTPVDEQRIVIVVEEPDHGRCRTSPRRRCRSGRNTIRARRSSIELNDPRRCRRRNRVRSPPARCRSSDRRGPVGVRQWRGPGRGPIPRTAWSHSLVLGRSRASARFRSCALPYSANGVLTNIAFWVNLELSTEMSVLFSCVRQIRQDINPRWIWQFHTWR